MMPLRLQSEELNIHHVGYPRQGMPVIVIIGRKSPSDPLDRNAIPDMNVLGDVALVVVISEITMIDLPEGYECSRRQKNVNQ